VIHRQRWRTIRSNPGASACPSRVVRGASTLTVLAAIATTALMAIVAQFAMLAPQEKLMQTLQVLTDPIAGHEPAGRPFGACGDVCSDGDGGCRYVVLRDGLHKGSRVSDAVLAAAEACY
jgi:hypothetical protein